MRIGRLQLRKILGCRTPLLSPQEQLPELKIGLNQPRIDPYGLKQKFLFLVGQWSPAAPECSSPLRRRELQDGESETRLQMARFFGLT